MKNSNKDLIKKMKEGCFQNVYKELDSANYEYTIDAFTRDFKNVSSEMKFAYLQYLIAKEETPDIHLLLCDFLMWTDTFFFDIYPVLKWHLNRALEISPPNIKVLQWITCTFNGHPDSPFSDEELSAYNKLYHRLRDTKQNTDLTR